MYRTATALFELTYLSLPCPQQGGISVNAKKAAEATNLIAKNKRQIAGEDYAHMDYCQVGEPSAFCGCTCASEQCNCVCVCAW